MNNRQPGGPEPDDVDVTLPGWVLRCWPQAWRRSYGEELSQTWADRGGSRSDLARLAGQGLWQRVVRPMPAAGVGDAERRTALDRIGSGGDVALVRPRLLLRTVAGGTTLTLIAACEVVVAVAMDATTAAMIAQGGDLSEAQINREGLLLTLALMVPVMAAVAGERLTRRTVTRDQGIGVLYGSLAAVLFAVVTPAVAALGTR